MRKECEVRRTELLRSLSATTLTFLVLCGAAQAGGSTADRPGAQDHPLVSRYAGSELRLHGEENYGSAPTFVSGNGKVKGKVESVMQEGRITNRLYWGPPGRTPLEVFRNYQSALRAAGYDTQYMCEEAQCHKDMIQKRMERWAATTRWAGGERSMFEVVNLFGNRPRFHYLHARKNGANGAVNVHLAVSMTEKGDRSQQFIQVIEAARMDENMVDAATIGSALAQEGRIALYGILFETGSAVVGPGSDATLEQMAMALKSKPALKVYIVGHTDNQGAPEANLALSRNRARAVAELLGSRHAIDPERLQAEGVASLAPVASNEHEQGRARNRRVELVLR